MHLLIHFKSNQSCPIQKFQYLQIAHIYSIPTLLDRNNTNGKLRPLRRQKPRNEGGRSGIVLGKLRHQGSLVGRAHGGGGGEPYKGTLSAEQAQSFETNAQDSH